jgi:hypothetical protein
MPVLAAMTAAASHAEQRILADFWLELAGGGAEIKRF